MGRYRRYGGGSRRGRWARLLALEPGGSGEIQGDTGEVWEIQGRYMGDMGARCWRSSQERRQWKWNMCLARVGVRVSRQWKWNMCLARLGLGLAGSGSGCAWLGLGLG